MDFDSKVLDVKEFNDIWYRSCFYNAIIPVVEYCIHRIDSYIISDFGFTYNLDPDKENGTLTMKTLDSLDRISYIKKLGIQCETQERCVDFVPRIKNAISNDKLVIVLVDCYYETFRVDTYHKNHWEHALLVNGFDKNNFHIVESEFIDSVKYMQRTIEHAVLEECYNGFLDNIYDGGYGRTFFEFSIDKSLDADSLNKIQEQLIREHLEKFVSEFASTKQTLDCVSQYAEMISDKETEDYFEFINKSITNMNKIISSLKVNKYIIQKYFVEDDELKEVFSDIIRIFSSTRGILAKIYYTKKNRETYTNRIRDNLDKIRGLSERILEKEYDLAQKYLNGN